jgi:hypothetical protein
MKDIVFKIEKRIYMDCSESYFLRRCEGDTAEYSEGTFDSIEEAKNYIPIAKNRILRNTLKSTETVHKESI